MKKKYVVHGYWKSDEDGNVYLLDLEVHEFTQEQRDLYVGIMHRYWEEYSCEFDLIPLDGLLSQGSNHTEQHPDGTTVEHIESVLEENLVLPWLESDEDENDELMIKAKELYPDAVNRIIAKYPPLEEAINDNQ